jgi:hypothetical protein
LERNYSARHSHKTDKLRGYIRKINRYLKQFPSLFLSSLITYAGKTGLDVAQKTPTLIFFDPS